MLADEMRSLGCRRPLKSFGLWMLGPVLLEFASEEQKREHLPPIARGEIRWCQGYSEPGAGSDLASLAARAVLDGDDYVVSGHKIWTSHADRSDWMFCLVRTDPSASRSTTGISLLAHRYGNRRGLPCAPSGSSAETHRSARPSSTKCASRERTWSGARAQGGPSPSDCSSTSARSSPRCATASPTRRRWKAWRAATSVRREVRSRMPSLRDRIVQANMDFYCNKITLRRSAEAAEAGRRAGPRIVDVQALRHRAEQAPPRAHGRDPRLPGSRLGRARGSPPTSSRARERGSGRAPTPSKGEPARSSSTSSPSACSVCPTERRASVGEESKIRMSFVLTEEQESIRRTAKSFFGERAPVAHLRALRDAADERGLLARALEGNGEPRPFRDGDPRRLRRSGARICRARPGAHRMRAHPGADAVRFHDAARAAMRCFSAGRTEQRRATLPASLRAGERIIAFAHDEGSRFAPYAVSHASRGERSGFRLTGEKTFVLDGHVADDFLVVARSAGATGERAGLTIFMVPAGAPGIDRHAHAHGRFPQRSAGAIRRHAGARDRWAARCGGRRARRRARPRHHRPRAEMLGGIEEAFDRTVAYLKTRKQFGVPIGSFQALKHRAAHLFCEIELSKSIVLDALRAIDAVAPGPPGAGQRGQGAHLRYVHRRHERSRSNARRGGRHRRARYRPLFKARARGRDDARGRRRIIAIVSRGCTAIEYEIRSMRARVCACTHIAVPCKKRSHADRSAPSSIMTPLASVFRAGLLLVRFLGMACGGFER